ncbi:hypothetical protein GCM10023350_11990 [Nocardioides endophyticus]|uniref:Uncharacterized protein n=1 Tax=Nocardioides endophyticus TaxID=1353775 RepID=A0ABP8YHF2_9ACTN
MVSGQVGEWVHIGGLQRNVVYVSIGTWSVKPEQLWLLTPSMRRATDIRRLFPQPGVVDYGNTSTCTWSRCSRIARSPALSGGL